jgi:hypothetical protein
VIVPFEGEGERDAPGLGEAIQLKEVSGMKKMVLLVFALLIVSSAVHAYSPDSTYVALFADTLRTSHRADYGGTGITPFEMWIWWLPSARGVQAAEFKIIYPASLIQGSVTQNDSLSISGGTGMTTGIYCAWIWCQHDWTWSHRQDLYLRNSTQGVVVIAPSNLSNKLQIGCCGGVPLEPVRKLDDFCLNYDCGLAVHEATWGAIKELYK